MIFHLGDSYFFMNEIIVDSSSDDEDNQIEEGA
jgi:hypothetical protein